MVQKFAYKSLLSKHLLLRTEVLKITLLLIATLSCLSSKTRNSFRCQIRCSRLIPSRITLILTPKSQITNLTTATVKSRGLGGLEASKSCRVMGLNAPYKPSLIISSKGLLDEENSCRLRHQKEEN